MLFRLAFANAAHHLYKRLGFIKDTVYSFFGVLNKITPMKFKHLYLLLAILGLMYTLYFNIQFYLTETDTSITNFIALTKTTLPAQSIIANITIVVITFLVWMIYESIKLRIKFWWIVIPLTFLVALAFSFPLFLYMRANRLEKIANDKNSNILNNN
jgi:hypothetical protein